MLKFLQPKVRHDVNLWIIPLKMSIASVLLFILTMIPDVLAANNVIHIPAWVSMGGIDDARAILSAMMGCVSTVLALIFSVALLVLSMVATLFGPRLLYRFVQDWVTQATIGLFMAAFIYVFLVFLVTHQDANGTFIPQISLITCWIFVLAAFGFLVFYSHRIASSIQNPDAVARIADDFRHALHFSNVRKHNNASGFSSMPVPNLELTKQRMHEGGAISSITNGYLQVIHHDLLIEAAVQEDAEIYLLFRPGQFIMTGETLAVVWPRTKRQGLQGLIEKHVKIGRHRVLDQDIEFGIAQIVEIAIRALSPAVNDTFTGVACVDWVGEALVALAESSSVGEWCDRQGKQRLWEQELKSARLIKFSFDQIRQSAADNPAVLIRILSIIARVGPRFRNSEERAALLEQANAVFETALSKNPVSMDRNDVEVSWKKTCDVLNSLSPVS